MKWQTSIGKAFEINKQTDIYGTFAEIGAGQETVNFFYKAGLASQTVAKSMSAYDMTVSDEIYGKQTRYVSQERLLTMLNREYLLLERRLKKKIGNKTSFFAFAVTAATSSQKQSQSFIKDHQAWMGLRFQLKALQDFNDITFYVNCRDQSRLQQHEALGILGVNLIYAGFRCQSNPKQLLSSLMENLSGGRVDIQGISCSGPAFKKFSSPLINLELLSQNVGQMAFFPNAEKSAVLSNFVFDKTPVILYGDMAEVKKFKENKSNLLKQLSLSSKKVVVIVYVPKDQCKVATFQKQLKQLCSDQCAVLVAPNQSLEKLKSLISQHTTKPIVFVVSESYFTKKMFSLRTKSKSLLKFLGLLFDQQTRVAVGSKNKKFSVHTQKTLDPQAQSLNKYLMAKKQILDLKLTQ